MFFGLFETSTEKFNKEINRIKEENAALRSRERDQKFIAHYTDTMTACYGRVETALNIQDINAAQTLEDLRWLSKNHQGFNFANDRIEFNLY